MQQQYLPMKKTNFSSPDLVIILVFSEVLSQLDEEIVAPAGGGDGEDNDVHIPDIPLDNPGRPIFISCYPEIYK